MRLLLLCATACCLAGCNLPPPTQAQRAARSFDSKSNSDPDAPSPRGILATGAPGDDAASALRCRPLGPDTICTRDR